MSRITILLIFAYLIYSVAGLDVVVSTNGPIQLGSNVTVTATVNGYAGENVKFLFWDNVQPQHFAQIVSNSNTSTAMFDYPASLYEPGIYIVTVNIQERFIIWYDVAEASTTFKLIGD